MQNNISIVVIPTDQLQALIEQAVDRALKVHKPSQPVAAVAPITPTTFPERMSRAQAAEYLGLSPKTLCVEVCRRRLRVPYIKAGRKVVYERVALERWLAERRVS